MHAWRDLVAVAVQVAVGAAFLVAKALQRAKKGQGAARPHGTDATHAHTPRRVPQSPRPKAGGTHSARRKLSRKASEAPRTEKGIGRKGQARGSRGTDGTRGQIRKRKRRHVTFALAGYILMLSSSPRRRRHALSCPAKASTREILHTPRLLPTDCPTATAQTQTPTPLQGSRVCTPNSYPSLNIIPPPPVAPVGRKSPFGRTGPRNDATARRTAPSANESACCAEACPCRHEWRPWPAAAHAACRPRATPRHATPRRISARVLHAGGDALDGDDERVVRGRHCGRDANDQRTRTTTAQGKHAVQRGRATRRVSAPQQATCSGTPQGKRLLQLRHAPWATASRPPSLRAVMQTRAKASE